MFSATVSDSTSCECGGKGSEYGKKREGEGEIRTCVYMYM